MSTQQSLTNDLDLLEAYAQQMIKTISQIKKKIEPVTKAGIQKKKKGLTPEQKAEILAKGRRALMKRVNPNN